MRTTIFPAYAGTSEPLPSQLPKGIQKRRNSATLYTTRWVFSTPSSRETWMMDRIPMLQHQETNPRTRVTLFMEDNEKREEWSVWELGERVPPSTAPELELDKMPDPGGRSESSSPERPQCQRQLHLPVLVLEVDADGEVVAWPGPGTTEAR